MLVDTITVCGSGDGFVLLQGAWRTAVAGRTRDHLSEEGTATGGVVGYVVEAHYFGIGRLAGRRVNVREKQGS